MMKGKKQDRVILDVTIRDGMATFNMIFYDTGEIRQKRRSIEWLMRRVFLHELRTWKKRGESVFYDIGEE